MQYGLPLAAALIALSATSAHADQWCGSSTQKDAVVQCGYSTSAQCADAVGKGGECFVDPDVARNLPRLPRSAMLRDAGNERESNNE